MCWKREPYRARRCSCSWKKPHDVEQQVVKVHAIGFLLAGHVLFMHVQDGVQVVGEVRIGVFQRFLDIGALIVRQAEQGGKDFRFGEAGGFLIQFEGLDHAFNHGFAVVGIHDRESRSIAQVFRVLAQDAVGNGMKRAAPQAGQVQGNQGANPFRHFTRRLVGEGQQQDVPRVRAVVQEPRHAVGQRARFSRTGPCNDERRSRFRRNGCILFFIKGRAVVDPGDGNGWRGILLDDVAAGHGVSVNS